MMNRQPPASPESPSCDQVQEWIFTVLDADAMATALGEGLESTTQSTARTSLAAQVGIEPQIQAILEAHVAQCPACQSYQSDMRQLLGSVAEIEDVLVPEGLADRIMGRIALEAPVSLESTPIPASVGVEATGEPALPSLKPQNSSRGTVSAPAPVSALRRYLPMAAAFLLLAMAVPLARQSMEQPQTEPAQQTLAQNPSIQTPGLDSQKAVEMPTELASVSSSDAPVEKPMGKKATPYRPGSASPSASTVRTAIAAGSVSKGVIAPANGSEDGSLLMAAVPATPSQYVDATYASEERSDLYYDPVSTLVGF